MVKFLFRFNLYLLSDITKQIIGKPGFQKQRLREKKREKDRNKYLEKERLRKKQKLEKIMTESSDKYIEHLKEDNNFLGADSTSS